MTRVDLRKELKHLYAPSAKNIQIVDVPEFDFVMVDGTIRRGETPPTSPEFQDAIAALYGAAYTLKFMSKLRKDNPVDYTVMGLEGLWWTDSGDFDFNPETDWHWTLMILQPHHITEDMYRQALRQVGEKRPNPALSKMRFAPFCEGLCIQTMHIGPYAEESRTVEKMKAFAQENGYAVLGKHHEIYLGDPRRAKAENLKTILRHPVRVGAP